MYLQEPVLSERPLRILGALILLILRQSFNKLRTGSYLSCKGREDGARASFLEKDALIIKWLFQGSLPVSSNPPKKV